MSQESGKTKHYDTMHRHDAPKVIANYLTDGVYCRHNQCNFMKTMMAGRSDGQDDYMHSMTIMAHAAM